jgi:hypothetical protein
MPTHKRLVNIRDTYPEQLGSELPQRIEGTTAIPAPAQSGGDVI